MIATLSAQANLDVRGSEILAAAITLRDSTGRDRKQSRVTCAECCVCSAKKESPASRRTEVSPPFTGCSPARFTWPPRDGIQRRLDKRNSLGFPHMRLPVPAGQVQNTAVLQNTCLPAAALQAHNSQVKFKGGCRQSATMMTPMDTAIGKTGTLPVMATPFR